MNTTYLLLTLAVALFCAFSFYLVNKTSSDFLVFGLLFSAAAFLIMFVGSFMIPIGTTSSTFIPINRTKVETTPYRLIITAGGLELTDKTAEFIDLAKRGKIKGVNYIVFRNAWGIELSSRPYQPRLEIVVDEDAADNASH